MGINFYVLCCLGRSNPITYSWYYWQTGYLWYLLWQAGIQEIVISTRTLLLVQIINFWFSPRNVPRLAYFICNKCLYFIVNCKIMDKVFESFVQISLEKNRSDPLKYCHVPECFKLPAGVNSIKLLHLYFTRWTVAFTSAQKIQFNNCLYKPKLQVSDL